MRINRMINDELYQKYKDKLDFMGFEKSDINEIKEIDGKLQIMLEPQIRITTDGTT